MNVHISQLPQSDWQQFKDFRLLAIKTDPFAFAKSYEDELQLTEQQWRDFLTSMWFATTDNHLIGMVGLVKYAGQPIKHNAFMVSFWIMPEYRGQGIGKQLVQFMQQHVKDLGIRNLELQVTVTQTAAIALYEKLGFEHVTVLKDAIQFDGIYYDQYLMKWSVE